MRVSLGQVTSKRSANVFSYVCGSSVGILERTADLQIRSVLPCSINPPFMVGRKELSVTRHYSPFADAADGYHTGLTSRKKIRTVTGPINLTSCKLAESSAGVFDWVKRLVSEP